MLDEVLDSPSADVNESNSDRNAAQGFRRRALNNASRDQRLQKRMESSIGSLESLDDRGLLEGGCSIPSSSSSLHRRNRRPLEMKNRTNRLKKRGKETVINALSHMIRVLGQKGLRLEEFCSSSDPNEIGTMKKILFVRILRNIGLPFSANDLSDVLLQYSEPPEYSLINYYSFLRAVGVLVSEEKERNGTFPEKREKNDWSQCIQVIFDVKRMFVETVENYKKIDDIYGMFSAWDNDATGTITSIQFLRVLERLHIVLTDQEEDFLVRLLDTNRKGRVEYENLLDFCFSGLDSVNQDSEQKSEKPLSIIIPNSDSNDNNDDTNNTNKKSKNNISGRVRASSVCDLSTNIVSTELGPPSLEKIAQNIPQRPTTAAARVECSSDHKKNITEPSSMIEAKEPSSIKILMKTEIERKLSLDAEDRQKIKDYAGNLIADSITYFKQKILSPFKFILDYTDDGIRNDDSGVNTPISYNTPSTPNTPVFINTPLCSNDDGDSFLTPNRLKYDVDASVVKRKFSVSDIVNNEIERGNRERNRGYIFGNNSPEISEYKEDKSHGLCVNISKMMEEEEVMEKSQNECNVEERREVQGKEQKAEIKVCERQIGVSMVLGDEYKIETYDAYEQDEEKEKEEEEEGDFKVPRRCENGVFEGDMESVRRLEVNTQDDAPLTEREQFSHQYQSTVESPGTVDISNNYQYNDSAYGSVRAIRRLRNDRQNRQKSFDRPVTSYTDVTSNTGGNDCNDCDSWSRQYPESVGSTVDCINNRNHVYGVQSFDLNPSSATYVTNYQNDPYNNPYYNAPQSQHQIDSMGLCEPATIECQPAVPFPTLKYSPPIEHLEFLAGELLRNVRDVVLTRYKTGKTLVQIYRHFDRDGRGYFDASDFLSSLSDLRIDCTEKVAALAVARIAIDSLDSVTYGEFHVYILDPTHCTLQDYILQYMAEQLESQGRGFQPLLRGALWDSNHSDNSYDRGEGHINGVNHVNKIQQRDGFVSTNSFIRSLQRIGLALNKVDLTRLVRRFDVNNDGACSAVRFVRSIENSEQWRHSEEGLSGLEMLKKDGVMGLRGIGGHVKENWYLHDSRSRDQNDSYGSYSDNIDNNQHNSNYDDNNYNDAEYGNSNTELTDLGAPLTIRSAHHTHHTHNTHHTHHTHMYRSAVISQITDTHNPNRSRAMTTRIPRPYSADCAIQTGSSNNTFNSYNFEANEKYDKNERNEDYEYLYSEGLQKLHHSEKEGNIYSSLSALNSEINGVFDTTERFLNNIIDPYDTVGNRNKNSGRGMLPRLPPFSDVKLMHTSVPTSSYQSRPMTAGFPPESSHKKNRPTQLSRPGTAIRNHKPPHSYCNIYTRTTDNKHVSSKSGTVGRITHRTKSAKPPLSVVDKLININKNRIT